MGRDVGAVLGAHPLGTLGGEVGGQPVDPGADHDADPDHGEQRHDGDVAGEPERAAVAHGEQHQRAHDEQHAGDEPGVRRPAAAAEHDPDRVDPAGGVEPALALRLVGLPPEQRDAAEPSSAAQNTAPWPITASTISTAPTPSAASTTAGPTSVSRRIRPGRRPPRVAPSMPGAAFSNALSAGSTSHSPA